ncbi:MAG: antibiotic biosynthesis monooxygenase [Flavobacteriales bacterium]|nr:antibiotic biosynthesis monooxygenase [Flavobacteriales bacterium]
MSFARTPEPPYYVVIFTSVLSEDDPEGYGDMAKEMEDLVKDQPGFLGLESSRTEIGITLSYWESLEAIRNWKSHLRHQEAQSQGKTTWYSSYQVRIAKVERDYGFNL